MMQLDLTFRSPLAEAIKRRDRSIARVGNSAGDAWLTAAAEFLRDYARSTHGEPFLIEDAKDVYSGSSPPDSRAWGAATRRAASRGWIRKAGAAPARSSNCSLKCTWRAAQ